MPMLKKIHPVSRLIGVLMIAAAPMLSPTVLGADLTVYTDALATGWQDWSWGMTPNLANPTPAHNGNAAIAVAYSAGWSGLQLGYPATLNTNGVDTLRFWIHGGSAGGQSIQVSVCDPSSLCAPANMVIQPQANMWTQVNVPLAGLGPVAYTIRWFNNTPNSQPTFYLDDITLVGLGTSPGGGPALSVDASADRHPISPYIYGMNFADEALAAELRLPVRRWGGNSTTRYNWQNDTHNTGSDWFFENIPEDNPSPNALPNGSAADRFVEQDRRTGTKTLMTAPLIGWTPKRRVETHPYDCGFNTTRYGAQQSTDSWDSNCGDGIRSTGTAITGNDPQDTSVEITPDFVKGWIGHLIGNYSAAAAGGVLFYSLDNEPMLWNSTHRDVHPQPASYDELRNRTYAYGAAIKAVDPAALTLGPVVWGWCAYFYSAVDQCSSSGADYRAHGNTPFVAWYLQQMRAYEQQHGVRILDYLDLHNYPQANGVYSASAGDGATQALRLRSTRSLWDPNYTDESWIGQPVSLIPRMRQWVANHYPGTKLAVTEYNWGALGHLNGALAQADILGIFGREGLDLATLWGPPTASQPGAMAFRMYRNYDGAGGSFGEVSVRAASANQDQLAIYAAEKNRTLTLMIINKMTTDLTSAVTLSGFTPVAAARVYRYSAANPNAIVQAPDQALTASGFSATFPASSITLVVAPASGSAAYPVTATAGAGGSVSPGSLTVNHGDTAAFTVTPNTGYRINTVTGCGGKLSGGLYTTGPITAACIVTAGFTTGSNLLTVAKTGNGMGVIVSNPTGIKCGVACSKAFPASAVVTLTAKANTGSTFAGWSGSTDCTGLGACVVTMTQARNITATFSRPILTVVKTGNGSVRSTVPASTPPGIDCGADCTESYNLNTKVTLTAQPGAGFQFGGWSGCTANRTNPARCVVTLNALTTFTVTATFK